MAEEDEGPIHTRDFRTIGMMWIVRHRHGGRQRFPTLQTFLDARERGEVADDDALSCDGVTWRLIGRIEDLPALFEEAWEQGADENASMYQTRDQGNIVDEPSVHLKFVPLPEPSNGGRPTEPATAAPAPSPEAAASAPIDDGRRLSTRSAMLLAAATGVIMALILAAIIFAVYTS